MTNPENFASRLTAEYAGFKFVDILPIPEYHELRAIAELYSCRYKYEIKYWYTRFIFFIKIECKKRTNK